MKKFLSFVLLICAGVMMYYGFHYAATENLPISFDSLKCDWFEIGTHKRLWQRILSCVFAVLKSSSGKTSVSYAFPFLLSYKFDWVEDNYCTRHPYFIYKRDRKHFQNFRGANKEFITGYAKSWRATHVIGGSYFVRVTCGAAIEVFDSEGMTHFKKKLRSKVRLFRINGADGDRLDNFWKTEAF